MKFLMYSRQDKGEQYQKALLHAGYEKASSWRFADFILGHHDQRADLRYIFQAGKKFFVHPHSARSFVLWDGPLPANRRVSCNFVQAEGQKEVMRRYRYPVPVEVSGWTYCPILPFRKSTEVKRVLFAPIHPNGMTDRFGRRLPIPDWNQNIHAYQALQKLPVELTVRIFGTPHDNGLPNDPRIHYQESDLTLNGSLEAMKGYDVIVGHQTFAYLAIASGYPTVMFGEDTIPHSGETFVQHWDLYKDMMMFPLDLLKGDPMAVLERAAGDEEAVRCWRDNFIGKQFDEKDFVDKVKKYL